MLRFFAMATGMFAAILVILCIKTLTIESDGAIRVGANMAAAEAVPLTKSSTCDLMSVDQGDILKDTVKCSFSEHRINDQVDKIDYRVSLPDKEYVYRLVSTDLGYQVTDFVVNGSSIAIESGSCQFGDGELACVVAADGEVFTLSAY